MKSNKKELSLIQREELLSALKDRFEKNHDCSAETPKGRTSVCYDREGLESRREHKPDMAAAIGIGLLTEEQYRELQKLGEFDYVRRGTSGNSGIVRSRARSRTVREGRPVLSHRDWLVAGWRSVVLVCSGTDFVDGFIRLARRVRKAKWAMGNLRDVPVRASLLFHRLRAEFPDQLLSRIRAPPRIVLWDTIIAKLSPDELRVVMAHEMGHYVLRHVLQGCLLLSLTYAGAIWLAYREQNLGVPRPAFWVNVWRGTHPTLGERIDFANSYHPWRAGQRGKYEHLFKDSE
jgi:hypothetical protein